jgi:predicted ATPase
MALGETPRIAVALARAAADAAVVVSGETHRLVRGCFSFRTLRELEIEGAAAPVRLLEVTAEAETGRPPGLSAPRGLTPVVGREGELTLLLDRWQQAVAGNGQVVVLVGEAGIGKSRLALDLVEQVGSACTRIELRCSPYHEASALHPIVEHLQRLVGAEGDATSRRQLARLERSAAAAGIGPDGTAVLGALLGVRLPDELDRRVPGEPRDLKQRTHELLADWLGGLARRRPVLVLLEDLQWADPSTLELLDVVLADLPAERVLAVATCRPDTQFGWPARSFVTQLTLCRLSPGDTSRLVHDILGGMELPAELLQEVIGRTDGVPLFVEELLKTILDTGLVEKEGDRLVRRSADERMAFPETLQDSLMARLDLLGPAKAIAQVASVLGREFSYELIDAVARIDSSRLSDALAILVQAELLERRGRPPHSRFAFHHALVQETAYRSLLRSDRREHHRDAAEALEGRFPEVAASQPELVAHHYTEAGLAEHAIPFWLRAGERAVARSANREAVEHLTHGVELIESLPGGGARSELELALRVPLGHALIADGGYAAAGVEQAYARIRDLAREVGEPERVGPALFALWMNYVGRGMHESARDTGEELLESGSRASADPVVYVGHRTVGWPLFLMGDLAGARAHLEQMTVPAGPDARRSLALYGADPVMAGEVYAAWTLCLLGGAGEARGRAERALELARSSGHPTGLAYALGMAAIFHQFLGEAAEAAALAREGIELAGDHGLKVWQGWCGVSLGWALVQTGEPEAGALEIAAGMEVARRAGARLFEPYCLALLAEAQGQAGQPSRALELLDEALTIAGSHRELFYEAEMHRLRGDLLLRSDAAAARQALERAAEVAHTQGARLFELRAAESLARLST